MGMRTCIYLPLPPFLVLLLTLLVVQETDAYLLDPDTVAAIPPPKNYFASPEFNSWARFILAGIGFAFLHISGVKLAIERKEYKIANLEDYYDQLEEYFSENFEDFPLPDPFPSHDFPIPADLPGPGGFIGNKYVRPGISGDDQDYDYEIFKRRADGSSHVTRSSSPTSSTGRQLPPGPVRGSLPHPSSPQRRSLEAIASSTAGNLQETMQKLVEAKEIHEVVRRTAQLVQEVVEKMDEDGCHLKLLCHLQEKPKDARTTEEDLLVRLYRMNAPTGAPTCEQEFPKCPVEEAQLVEGFSYLWQMQNTV